MSNLATRVDPATGVEQRLEHVATPRGLLYTWTARPPEATSCVLVCSSLFGDFTANYHRERLFGHLAAAKGHGVVRFHYAGEGNSQGERSDMTFASLCDDARLVMEHAESLGFSDFAVLGTRVGALVAAMTVSSMPSSVPLALWEPVENPIRFLADAQRANRMSRTAHGGSDETGDWRQELIRNGVVNLLGYDIYPGMVESLEPVNLVSALGDRARAVFLARFRHRAEKADHTFDSLLANGFAIETATFGLSEPWWFHSERIPESGNLISDTVDWVNRALSETVRSEAP